MRWELKVIKTVKKRLLLRKWRTILYSVCWGGDLTLRAVVSRRGSALPECGSSYLGHMHWMNHLRGTSFFPLRREPKIYTGRMLDWSKRLTVDVGTSWLILQSMNRSFSSGRSVFPLHFPASCKYQLIKASWGWRQDLVFFAVFEQVFKDVLRRRRSCFVWSNYLQSKKNQTTFSIKKQSPMQSGGSWRTELSKPIPGQLISP